MGVNPQVKDLGVWGSRVGAVRGVRNLSEIQCELKTRHPQHPRASQMTEKRPQHHRRSIAVGRGFQQSK